jgi:GNAT superfamily N-acetyltransferase
MKNSMWDLKDVEKLARNDYPLKIEDLLDYPESFSIAADWIHGEWARFSGRSWEETLARFSQNLERGKLPVSLIAIHEGQPAGLASLREKDSVDWYPGLTPWICNVYVDKAARGKKVATLLCRALEKVAILLGYSAIFLATEYEDSLYHNIGYRTFKEIDYKELHLYLCRLDIS